MAIRNDIAYHNAPNDMSSHVLFSQIKDCTLATSVEYIIPKINVIKTLPLLS